MPSMFGGDSSGRDYAPHMYVLQVGGDIHSDNGYHFVGGATAYYEDRGPDTTKITARYHVGVTVLGELVCDVTASRQTRGLLPEEIPQTAKDSLLRYGLQQVPSIEGLRILEALQIELPDNIEPTDYGLLFNGTPEQKSAELAKRRRYEAFTQRIRIELLGECPAD